MTKDLGTIVRAVTARYYALKAAGQWPPVAARERQAGQRPPAGGFADKPPEEPR